MADFKKILVAVAFSEYSEEIFLYASELASRLASDLIVASIINQRDVQQIQRIQDMGYAMDSEQYVRDIKAERKRILEGLIKKAGFPAERIRTIFRVGNPIDALLKIIMAEDVDMVVMGLKGRTDLEHVIIGSVADKLFRRSPVTVVSFRDRKSRERLKARIHA